MPILNLFPEMLANIEICRILIRLVQLSFHCHEGFSREFRIKSSFYFYWVLLQNAENEFQIDLIILIVTGRNPEELGGTSQKNLICSSEILTNTSSTVSNFDSSITLLQSVITEGGHFVYILQYRELKFIYSFKTYYKYASLHIKN